MEFFLLLWYPCKNQTYSKMVCQKQMCPDFKFPDVVNWHYFFFFFLLSLDGLAAFRAFLKSEFCEENIEFWLACEDFKKTKSPQKLTSKAKKIYNDFIEKEAPKEVKKTYLNITALLWVLKALLYFSELTFKVDARTASYISHC